MRIEYEKGVDMPESLNIYYNADNAVTFHDDGAYPDSAAGDRIYAAYVQEDLDAFVNQIISFQNSIQKEGGVLAFRGHAGTMISADDILPFDVDGFGLHNQVEINLYLINAINCGTALLKQNSLFITDLSVVEDPARTYNVANGTGNSVGVWTFGNLIKNIANPLVTGVSVKTFLKKWLMGWTDGRVVNGQTVAPRRDVLRFLIGPWLQKCNSGFGANYFNDIVTMGDQWKTDWDNTNEADLLKNAPFKLMAIVNRLDLRGNTAYTNMNNAGETRFIYTLEAPIRLSDVSPAGFPPKGFDGIGSGGSCTGPIDWEGMNVIIEYGNPIDDVCALRDYAQAWLNLSTYTIPSAAYNDALEAITHTVIDANRAPNKPNKSALDQIRTNERIFFQSACQFDNTSQQAWSKSDWELSQFELDASDHWLHAAPVSNTPMNETNMPWYLTIAGYSTGGTSSNWTSQSNPTDHPGSNALLEWVFAHNSLVHSGNYRLPLSYTYNGDEFKLAATAVVDAEQVHYWDIPWYNSNTAHYSNVYNNSNEYPYQKDMRQQLSLNTCQGCHCGETKTTFTMVHPMPYGQSANYWGNIPNGSDGNFPVDERTLDTRFTSTIGSSNVNGTIINPDIQNNHKLYPGLQYFPRVSPFITGRNYSGNVGNGTFEDDKYNPQDPFDNILKGMFYVYDPTDYFNNTTDGDQSYPKKDRVNGYNELEARRTKLCQFVFGDCHGGTGGVGNSIAISIVLNTSFIPLPLNGH